jgi:hypothetical protein
VKNCTSLLVEEVVEILLVQLVPSLWYLHFPDTLPSVAEVVAVAAVVAAA